MRKIQVVTLEEARPLSPQIDRWELAGWSFQGFMRRAEGMWETIHAIFEMEVAGR
jgi:hypothetical protein